MIKKLALLLVLVLLLVAAEASADSQRLTFLHVNDVYEIMPRDGIGGLAELQTLVRKERSAATHSLFTFGGDLLSPSLLSGLTRGAHLIEFMNLLGVDVAVPGNHEFDFGPDNFIQRRRESRFPWLINNMIDAEGKPYGGMINSWIYRLPPATPATPDPANQFGEIKIGFLGLITPDTATSSKPGPSVTFQPVIETAQAAAAALQAAGADMVVALTHLPVAEDRQLATAVPAIDLILGGHDHDPMAVYEGPTLIVKAGSDAFYLAAIEIGIERTLANNGRKRITIHNQGLRLITTRGVIPDPEAANLAQRQQAQLNADMSKPLATLTIDLDSRREGVRSRESSMADVIADAMRAATEAEVALINGGGVRGNRLHQSGTPITVADILSELPFGDVTLLMELKGTDLLATLENGLGKVESGSGRFLQVSGLRMVWDGTKPPGQRVIELSIGGKPLEPERVYRVAVFDYLYSGSDGFDSLRHGKLLIDASAATLTATQTIEYLSRHGAGLTVGDRIIRR
ncbi:5'-nucleotidase [uncultured Gammaproteobacteria bacterium]